CGVAWDQERPDELWIGNRNSNNQIIIKDPSLMKPKARSFADLPGGHSEGYDDTFKQVFRRFYASILDPAATPEYPQFADGLRGVPDSGARAKGAGGQRVGGWPRAKAPTGVPATGFRRGRKIGGMSLPRRAVFAGIAALPMRAEGSKVRLGGPIFLRSSDPVEL